MTLPNALKFGQRLRCERERLNWSQERLAEVVGTTARSINRWEQGKVIPQPHYREQLCQVLNLSTEALFSTSFEKNHEYCENRLPPPLWHVPYQRNPFFTGREAVLSLLHETLHLHPRAALSQSAAISGLGGIGKTQTAIEYAYRYRDSYQAVFWLKADTSELLIAEMLQLAPVFGIVERDQQQIVEAVKRWLNQHTGWLLILDNVEDVTTLQTLLPSMPEGSILLTTRSQIMGTLAERIDLEQMEQEEGILFLLRRARLITKELPLEATSPAVRRTAQEIFHLLGGLPLALDQAGAYIEETGCSLSHYLTCYQTRQAMLLNRRGASGVHHPMSVTTTFSLALEQVEHVNPAAADLLRLSAFLHPDAIPEEIICAGKVEPGSSLEPLVNDLVALDTAYSTLRHFSLVRRSAETKTVTIHRLVQAVVKDSMDERQQHCWVARTVCILNAAFPDMDNDEVEAWPRRQQYLPQVYAVATLIEQWQIASVEAGFLLYKVGCYLGERASYTQAEVFLEKARDIHLRVFTPDHPQVAQTLVALANIYYLQGHYTQTNSLTKYSQAETLYQQALALQEKSLGTHHPDVAASLNHLAVLYVSQKKYTQAQTLFQSALAIYQKTPEMAHCRVALLLSNLGKLSMLQGHYAQAEPFLQRSLATYKQIMELESPSVAVCLNHLAVLYASQGKYAQAESLFGRTLALYEQSLGYEHPRVAETCTHLARLYTTQDKYPQAVSLYQRVIAIRERILEPTHPDLAESCYALACLYGSRGATGKAEPLYQQALAIWKKTLGLEHPQVIACRRQYGILQRER